MQAWSIVVMAAIVLYAGLGRVVLAQHAPPPGVAVLRTSGVLTIGGAPHPYLAEGKGVTCVVVGLAGSYPPLFSDRLKERIRFIYVDFKNTWNMEAPKDIETIGMDRLVDEVDEVRRALQLDKVCLVGHSAPGLVAVEYALRHPERVDRAILVSVEPYFTDEFRQKRTQFWEAEASAERKAAYQANVARLPDDVLRTLSPRDRFALGYVRNGPRYFFDPSYDFYWAWAGKHYSAELLNRYLGKIAADYDPRSRMERNSVPMFLALGRYDYNIPYHEWDSGRKTTPRLTSRLFERSGHFPMLEESRLFDDSVIQWLDASARDAKSAAALRR